MPLHASHFAYREWQNAGIDRIAQEISINLKKVKVKFEKNSSSKNNASSVAYIDDRTVPQESRW